VRSSIDVDRCWGCDRLRGVGQQPDGTLRLTCADPGDLTNVLIPWAWPSI
jgi:hypothetical protein